jgi:hypothetical protein
MSSVNCVKNGYRCNLLCCGAFNEVVHEYVKTVVMTCIVIFFKLSVPCILTLLFLRHNQ